MYRQARGKRHNDLLWSRNSSVSAREKMRRGRDTYFLILANSLGSSSERDLSFGGVLMWVMGDVVVFAYAVTRANSLDFVVTFFFGFGSVGCTVGPCSGGKCYAGYWNGWFLVD